ncbi:MAG: sulfatase [Bryobacterales bacterium]|nr:sulfatase [Bryobacterales bacterium]
MSSTRSSSPSSTPSRRGFLRSALGVGAGISAGALGVSFAQQSQSRRPNILLILVDDWGWADMGAYGSTFYETPHLDKLARDGVRFTNGYASCPVCSPTRAAVMTGKAPPRVNITDWIPGRRPHEFSPIVTPEDSDRLAHEEVTIAEMLKPLGYATAHIGKWHLGGEGYGPTTQGFDVNIAGTDKGSPPGYFAPYRAPLPGIENSPPGEFLTRRLCDEAENYMEANRERPFFMYYALFAVHTPLEGEAPVIAKYAKKTNFLEYQRNPVYASMVESLDDSIGRLRAKLAMLGLEKDTIILVTSDNGGLLYEGKSQVPATYNRPLRAGKGHLYEGGTRVPFMIYDPQAKHRVDDTPVISTDLLPTIAAYTGARPPSGIDGVSLRELVRDDRRIAERDLCWHYPHYSNQGGFPGGSIRSGDWKLVENFDSGAVELYNLRTDLREENNLARSNTSKVRELQAKLESWRKRVGAKMPTKNPDYDPAKADQELTGSRRENQ